MKAVKYNVSDENLLIGLFMSGGAIFVKAISLFESKDLTSISLFDPTTQKDYTFDISNVRVEEKIEDNKNKV